MQYVISHIVNVHFELTLSAVCVTTGQIVNENHVPIIVLAVLLLRPRKIKCIPYIYIYALNIYIYISRYLITSLHDMI